MEKSKEMVFVRPSDMSRKLVNKELALNDKFFAVSKCRKSWIRQALLLQTFQ